MKIRHTQSPLSYKQERFNRAYKKTGNVKENKKILTAFLKALYIFLLITIDLILFAGSGNLDIFGTSELLVLVIIMAVFSGTLIALFYFSEKVQNFICSLMSFWFIITVFHQFSQFNPETFIGNFLRQSLGNHVPEIFYSHSYIVLALFLSCMVLWIMFKASWKILMIFVAMFVFALVGILQHEYSFLRNQHDFIETYQSTLDKRNNKYDQKFVYFMLPNLASYKYFGMFNDEDEAKTQAVVHGFFAKNNFTVYPNAYNISSDAALNMVQMLNSFDQKTEKDTPDDYIMDTMMLYRYWRFFNIGNDFILLKENQLFDTFKKADYKISAYKSRGVDTCAKQYDFNVDRCVEKINRPINLYNINLPLGTRTKLLFIEWLTSMNIFKDLSYIYKTMEIFAEPEEMPMIGINYNNLQVFNSIKTFDMLTKHIISDNGRQAYFVYADIPSDMFIYDEYCHVKPQEEWISLKNLPWVNVDNSKIRRKAYNEQIKCLYGKLQEFIDTLEKHKILKSTVIIIDGVSGTNNFQTKEYEDFEESMLYNRLTTMAIKTPGQKEVNIKSDICTTESIINNYLYKAPMCAGIKEKNVHFLLQNKLEKKLEDLNIPQNMSQNNIITFETWYKTWVKNNYEINSMLDIVSKDSDVVIKEKIYSDIPDLKNETLQNPDVSNVTVLQEVNDTADVMFEEDDDSDDIFSNLEEDESSQNESEFESETENVEKTDGKEDDEELMAEEAEGALIEDENNENEDDIAATDENEQLPENEEGEVTEEENLLSSSEQNEKSSEINPEETEAVQKDENEHIDFEEDFAEDFDGSFDKNIGDTDQNFENMFDEILEKNNELQSIAKIQK